MAKKKLPLLYLYSKTADRYLVTTSISALLNGKAKAFDTLDQVKEEAKKQKRELRKV